MPFPWRPCYAGMPRTRCIMAVGRIFLAWRIPWKRQGSGRWRKLNLLAEIRPDAKKVTYELSISRIIDRKLVVGLADGTVAVDDKIIYTTKSLKVGLFTPDRRFRDSRKGDTMKRAVITGMGIVSCIGNNKSEVTDSLRQGKSGIKQRVLCEIGMRSHVSGSIEIDTKSLIDRKFLRFMGDASC